MKSHSENCRKYFGGPGWQAKARATPNKRITPSNSLKRDYFGQQWPKICLELSAGRLSAGTQDEAGMRRVKQLGVDYVLTGGPQIPWQEADIRARIGRLKAGGLTLYNMMIGGFPNTLYGKPGRDEEIDKVRQSIRAAGRAGLPVI